MLVEHLTDLVVQVFLILRHHDAWCCQQSLLYEREHASNVFVPELKKVKLLECTLRLAFEHQSFYLFIGREVAEDLIYNLFIKILDISNLNDIFEVQ